jgi:hypothetical protein
LAIGFILARFSEKISVLVLANLFHPEHIMRHHWIFKIGICPTPQLHLEPCSLLELVQDDHCLCHRIVVIILISVSYRLLI